MSRNPTYYPFSPWHGLSKRKLTDAARDYFGQRNYYVRESGRVPDNMDINTWVYMFIQRSIRGGMIAQEALVEDIPRLTELLWDIAVMEMMELTEDEEDLPW